MANIQNFLNIVPVLVQDKYEKINAHKYEEKMKARTKKELIEHFKPYNEELYTFMGVDFGWENE